MNMSFHKSLDNLLRNHLYFQRRFLSQSPTFFADEKWQIKEEEYERFMNFVTRNRKPSLLRRMTDLQLKAKPGTSFLSGGYPNPDLFPFKSATFELENGQTLHLDDSLMKQAQQYGSSRGHLPLLEKVQRLVQKYHAPPRWESSMTTITAGAQDGFSRALEMTVSPGDYVIVEDPSFSSAISMLDAYDVKYLGVESDVKGMKTDALRKVLSKWTAEEVRSKNENVPKVIYLNPTAANPSGRTVITERKKEVYQIAREYNLIILEDDPYYFIHYDNEEGYPKSFLSMDTDGRVLRFDSFSKILSSGMRVGFVTGPAPLVQKMLQHTEVTILHTSSLSQVVINELLNKWTEEEFQKRIFKIKNFYQSQRNAMMEAAQMHLKGLCEWESPSGGMFLWVKVLGVDNTDAMVMDRGLSRQILMTPGSIFKPSRKPCPYVRLSYSFASPEEMKLGCFRLANLIKEELKLQSSK